MKLKEFTVRNFRSISEGHKLPIDENFTVLLGKNNEGKSNLLRALALAFEILKVYARSRHNVEFLHRIFNYPHYRSRKNEYVAIDAFNWERDYPISKQNAQRQPPVFLRLDFKLTPDEQIAFRKKIGKKINEDLPLIIEIPKNKEIELRIPKKAHGNSAKGYDYKIKEIAEFICDLFNFIYIPAIRPAEYSMKVISELIRKEFELQAENSEKYKEAKEIVNSFTQKTLEKISTKIKTQIKEFIDIQDISINSGKENSDIDFLPSRYQISDYDIRINDGCETSLYEKGDGLKSLMALSLVKALNNTGNVFLAIEEPESHLHPSAIKKIKNILEDISSKNQVIISTHSPLLADRQNLRNNLIITNKKAKCVTKISEIRKELGVEVSDNLVNAEFILLVEGKSDKIALKALLSSKSDILKKAFNSNKLIIDTLAGASNLSYKASIYINNMCKIYCYLDSDNSGKEAIKKALDGKYISGKDYTLISILGYREAELEDIYNDTLYKDFLQTKYSIALPKNFWKNKHKWSDRIKEIFISSGKIFDENEEKKLKVEIAELVKENTEMVVNEHRGNSFNILKENLENLILGKTDA